MAEAFDAYHRWLGISPKDQPPNYYRLLGLGKFESDAEVIGAAADRAAQYIGTCAQPPYDKLAAKLIERIGRARATLLDPAARTAYDAKLRAAVGVLSTSAGTHPAASPVNPAQQIEPHQTPAATPMPATRAKLPSGSGAHAAMPKQPALPPVSKTTLQHLKYAKPIAEAVPASTVVQPVAKVQLVQPASVPAVPVPTASMAPAAEMAMIPDEPFFASAPKRGKSGSSAGRKSYRGRKQDANRESKPNWLLLGGGALILLVLIGVGGFLLMRDKGGETGKAAAKQMQAGAQHAAGESVVQAGDAAADSPSSQVQSSSTLATDGLDADQPQAALGATTPPAARRQTALAASGELPELIAVVSDGGSAARIEELAKGGVNLEAKDRLGRTALRVAVLANRLDLVTALLAAEAKVNTADARGETPLMSSAQAGNLKMLEALLAAGADHSAKTTRGTSDKPAGLTALLVAARHSRTEAVQALLAKGAAVDAANQDGVTPLMAAAAGGDVKTVEVLLMEKASATAIDKRGQTPLMFAAHGGNLDVVNMLLKQGAMANARTPEQVSALSIALDAKHAKLAEVLREAAKKEGPIIDF